MPIYMSEVIEHNKKLIEKKLQAVADDQNVVLKKIEWLYDDISKYTLKVSSLVEWFEEKVFAEKEITDYQHDNRVKSRVRMKLDSIVMNFLKK